MVNFGPHFLEDCFENHLYWWPSPNAPTIRNLLSKFQLNRLRNKSRKPVQTRIRERVKARLSQISPQGGGNVFSMEIFRFLKTLITQLALYKKFWFWFLNKVKELVNHAIEAFSDKFYSFFSTGSENWKIYEKRQISTFTAFRKKLWNISIILLI